MTSIDINLMLICAAGKEVVLEIVAYDESKCLHFETEFVYLG